MDNLSRTAAKGIQEKETDMKLNDLLVSTDIKTKNDYLKSKNGNWDVQSFARRQLFGRLLVYRELTYGMSNNKSVISGADVKKVNVEYTKLNLVDYSPEFSHLQRIKLYHDENTKQHIPFAVSDRIMKVNPSVNPNDYNQAINTICSNTGLTVDIDFRWLLYCEDQYKNIYNLNNLIACMNGMIRDNLLIQNGLDYRDRDKVGWDISVVFCNKKSDIVTPDDIGREIGDCLVFGNYDPEKKEIQLYRDMIEGYAEYVRVKDGISLNVENLVMYALAHQLFWAFEDFDVDIDAKDMWEKRETRDKNILKILKAECLDLKDELDMYAEYFALRFVLDILKDNVLFDQLIAMRKMYVGNAAGFNGCRDAVTNFGDITAAASRKNFIDSYTDWVQDNRAVY